MICRQQTGPTAKRNKKMLRRHHMKFILVPFPPTQVLLPPHHQDMARLRPAPSGTASLQTTCCRSLARALNPVQDCSRLLLQWSSKVGAIVLTLQKGWHLLVLVENILVIVNETISVLWIYLWFLGFLIEIILLFSFRSTKIYLMCSQHDLHLVRNRSLSEFPSKTNQNQRVT